jgi:hypothetical protein
MRIVLDTNQFVSALISPAGNPARIMDSWRQGKVELAVSPSVLNEVHNVLHRPHIKRKYHLTDLDIKRYVLLLEQYALIVPGLVRVNVVLDDPNDNIIVACALEAEADYLVSGDRHLLDLGEIKGIPIVRASEFLKILKVKVN